MNKREKGIQWFQEHCGWSDPPGQRECAKRLYDARELALARGYEWVWEEDEEAYYRGYWEERPTEVLNCLLFDNLGYMVASLRRIADPDNNHRRLVEAELALKVLGDEI